MTLPLRVVKLGGRLFDWPELPAAFRAWRNLQPPGIDVLVVGGGALVDCLRELDRIHGLGEESSHWLSLQAMRVTARLATGWWPESALAERLDDVRRLRSEKTLIVCDLWHSLVDAERALGGPVVPHEWSVTSDSLAAWAAGQLEADELTLLKSSLPAKGATLADLTAARYVDGRFADFAARLRAVRCVDLRSPDFASVAADLQVRRKGDARSPSRSDD